MKENLKNKPITPLWIIAGAIVSIELFLTIAAGFVTGTIQNILIAFIIIFALLTLCGFFLILWNRPHHLYAPSEYLDNERIPTFANIFKQDSFLTESIQKIPDTSNQHINKDTATLLIEVIPLPLLEYIFEVANTEFHVSKHLDIYIHYLEHDRPEFTETKGKLNDIAVLGIFLGLISAYSGIIYTIKSTSTDGTLTVICSSEILTSIANQLSKRKIAKTKEPSKTSLTT